MEICFDGPGELLVRFVDRAGCTRLESQIHASGSATTRTMVEAPECAQSEEGPVDLIPVLCQSGSDVRRLTFDGCAASEFTARRARALGCSPDVADDLARGRAQALADAPLASWSPGEIARLARDAPSGTAGEKDAR